MAVNGSGIRTWSLEFQDGERWECRRLRTLIWHLICPRWTRRYLNAWDTFRWQTWPCFRHGHRWEYFDEIEDWKDARECERCGAYEVLEDRRSCT